MLLRVRAQKHQTHILKLEFVVETSKFGISRSHQRNIGVAPEVVDKIMPPPHLYVGCNTTNGKVRYFVHLCGVERLRLFVKCTIAIILAGTEGAADPDDKQRTGSCHDDGQRRRRLGAHGVGGQRAVRFAFRHEVSELLSTSRWRKYREQHICMQCDSFGKSVYTRPNDFASIA